MIDKLISSDLAALAAEDRQAIFPTESAWLQPSPTAQEPRRSWRPASIVSTVPFVIAGAAAGILYEESLTVAHDAPQLAIALGLVVMAMLGLAGGAPRSRPLADILTAGLFTLVAAVGFAVEWHHHRTDCVFVDGYGVTAGPCQDTRVATTTWFAVCAWGAVMVVAMAAARFARRTGPQTWSVASKLITASVLLTWTGLNQYVDRTIALIRFHATPWLEMGARGVSLHRVRAYDPYSAFWITSTSDRGQWNAIEAGLVSLGLAILIGIACVRETKRPSRWLRLLESPLVIPLGAIVASVMLVLATAQFELLKIHRGDPDDIPWFAACGSIGAVVAFASMLLRRRRREALS